MSREICCFLKRGIFVLNPEIAECLLRLLTVPSAPQSGDHLTGLDLALAEGSVLGWVHACASPQAVTQAL